MKQLFFLSLFLFPVFLFAQQTSQKTDSLSGKRVFKIDFIAPVTGNFTIGYEQAVSKSVSLDFQVGIIGAGANVESYNNIFGIFIKAGPCLYFTPNYEAVKSKNFSRFQGTYIKPTLSISSFSYGISSPFYDVYGNYLYTSTLRQNNTSCAILLNIGHQFVFNRKLSLNLYGGVGYYILFSSSDGYTDDSNYAYGYYGAGSQFPLAIDGGIEIGLVSK